jgi:hypothetical protein
MTYTPLSNVRRPSEDVVRNSKLIAWSLLIVFVLYGDGLAILSEFPILGCTSAIKFIETDTDCKVLIGAVPFSLPKLLFTFFNGGGVFNRVPDNNIEYAIFGRRVGKDPKQPWEDLGFVKSCFPYDCGGEIYTRMELPWHQIIGKETYTKAMSNMVIKIKNKYNREHLEDPVEKIAIYLVWWPRSEAGFYDLKRADNTSWRLLAEE